MYVNIIRFLHISFIKTDTHYAVCRHKHSTCMQNLMFVTSGVVDKTSFHRATDNGSITVGGLNSPHVTFIKLHKYTKCVGTKKYLLQPLLSTPC